MLMQGVEMRVGDVVKDVSEDAALLRNSSYTRKISTIGDEFEAIADQVNHGWAGLGWAGLGHRCATKSVYCHAHCACECMPVPCLRHAALSLPLA